MAEEKAMKKAEMKYNVSDFVRAASSFGVTADIVTAAFAVAGVNEATKTQGKKIIDEFTKKEVK